MAFEEVAIISCAITVSVCAVSIAYYMSEQRKAVIQQNGITQRAAMKSGGGVGDSTSPYNQNQWWVPLASELLKNPQIQNLILQKIPGLSSQTENISKLE